MKNKDAWNIGIIVVLFILAHIAVALGTFYATEINMRFNNPNEMRVSLAAVGVMFSIALWAQSLQITSCLCKTGSANLVEKCFTQQLCVWIVFIGAISFAANHMRFGTDITTPFRIEWYFLTYGLDSEFCYIANKILKKLYI